MNFFLKAIIVYFLSYAYIRLWCWRLLVEVPQFRRHLLVVTDLSTLVLPLALYASQRLPLWFAVPLQTIGYCWAAIIAFLVPWALLAEPIRFIVKRVRPGFTLCSKTRAFAAVAIISGLMVIGGFINARSPRIQEIELKLPAGKGQQRELILVALSDLHAGKMVSKSWIANIVAKVNALSPDAILLLGDILGDRYVERNGMMKELGKLNAPLGVFAVLGNHEYYLDPNWSSQILEKAGITVLEDEAVTLENSLMLAGRQDFTVQRRGGQRLPLKEILAQNPSLPVILMDHNPKNLADAAKSKIALQLSGHTHNGQLFPFNYLIDLIFEKGWGEFRKGNTRYYISCGVGTWGPPLRTSSVPEILRIKIQFGPD